MKKVFIGAASIIMLAACQTNPAPQSQETDSVVSKSEVVEKTEKAQPVPFVSSDRQRLCVRGNVTKLLVRSADCDSSFSYSVNEGDWVTADYAFDENGICKRVDHVNVERKEKRNADGQLLEWEEFISDFGVSISEAYEYNEQGFLVKVVTHGIECEHEKTIQYDNNQDCISTVTVFEGEGMVITETNKFVIKERDANGNWTKRFVTTYSKTSPWDKPDQIESEETVYGVELREITYAKD